MTIVRRASPLGELVSLRQAMDRLFETAVSTGVRDRIRGRSNRKPVATPNRRLATGLDRPSGV